MLLEYLGAVDAAERLVAAVEAVYAAGASLTFDQGGPASTREFTDAVLTELGRGSPAKGQPAEAAERADGQ
jgi:isocitrate/isopropylmalate dehydrogenase